MVVEKREYIYQFLFWKKMLIFWFLIQLIFENLKNKEEIDNNRCISCFKN